MRKIIAYKKVIGGPLPKLIILGQKLKKMIFFVELGKKFYDFVNFEDIY